MRFTHNVIGISGLPTSIGFKRREYPGLSARFYNIAQGFDAAACLTGPEGILAAAAEERFTRHKATGAFPLEAIRYCLTAGKLEPRDVAAVAHGFAYEPGFELDERSRRAYAEVYSPEVIRGFLREHFGDARWHEKLMPVPHHLAHAASTFYPSGFPQALILVSDGMGETQSLTVAVGEGTELTVLKEISAFHSLGTLYGVVTMYLGFLMNSDEYKVMGLAPYGNSRRFFNPLMEFVRLKPDGTYAVPVFARNETELERETHAGVLRHLRELFGPEREPEAEITQDHKDIAAGLQAVLETCQLHVLRHFREQSGQRHLCLAGGVALNCAANGVIRRSGLFERVFVQPAAGDDGTALGAALYAQRRLQPGWRPRPMTMPLWGPEFSNDEIRQALARREDCLVLPKPTSAGQACRRDSEVSATGEDAFDGVSREVAERIAQGQIVAWFQGRMEFGPRALGSRSILADPRDPEMRDKINALVKKREAFRPFAPVVTREAAARIFEIAPGDEAGYAHMLYVTRVRPEYRDKLPATTHVDGSARVQTVSREENPRLWQLLNEFEKLTGLPVLLNTSFNVRGQPIVCTPQEAIDTFLAAKLDLLVAGDLMIVPRKLSEAERHKVLVEWNDTRTPPPPALCVHEFFEAQAQKSPGAVAVVFETQELTYGELDRRANQLGAYLRQFGVGPESLAGICLDPSLDLPVALLGILKAGGAYVPLDPDYPQERLQHMVQDADLKVILTHTRLAALFPGQKVICLDADRGTLAAQPAHRIESGARPENLAYVIYTSGSTGKPKGVMVEHRNVANFFIGMDARLGTEPGVWMSVTSISFDISVLELFWTLARGYKVVLARRDFAAGRARKTHTATANRSMNFSLFYFASEESAPGADKYRLLLEGARFADERGFTAVWTPERHFHAFGGLYPNPSVTSAAIAAITRRVQIRAGSVVLPLHHTIRVAEEWSVVDNLSHGRVAISLASGWQVNDFALAPGNYARRKEIMLEQIETLRRLWRGETVVYPGAEGKPVSVRVLPRPVQPELPLWLTASGNPETFQMAGELGANLLTHLLGQNLKELAAKIELYRNAWRANGHAGQGQVALMLHTFVAPTLDEARTTVRRPMIEYLRSSLDLIKNRPLAFSAFKQTAAGTAPFNGGPDHFTEEEVEHISGQAFERYFDEGGFFGNVERCLQRVEQLRALGVDEVACLIDFGVETSSVLSSLEHLDEVRRRANTTVGVAAASADFSLAGQMARHGVTHLQCTPSLASLLAEDPASLAALRTTKKLLLGGEALPPGLLRKLDVPGEVLNMYGPTETTIWSTCCTLKKEDRQVTIGRPIANTEIYIVDEARQPVAVGVPGELLIGGAGVVRGYWGRPELTAEKFILNPCGFGRVYRTGDLARYRPDGNIEFLGRIDQQVKLRGYRVELGEIEAVLERHPQVKQCAAQVREDLPGDQRLVAYVVPAPGTAPSADSLRTWAGKSLPSYMVPSAFAFLAALPLTPNGKLDRKSLPKPPTSNYSCNVGQGAAPKENGAAPESASNGQRPSAFAGATADVMSNGDGGKGNGSEVPNGPTLAVPGKAASVAEQVETLWRSVLGVSQCARTDNFFELGGNSILATRLITRLRAALKWEVPLRFGFAFPTLGELTEALERHAPPSTAARTNPTIARRANRQEYPLSFAQERFWFLDQLEPGPRYNNAFNLRLTGTLNVAALERALNEVVARHETLRAVFTSAEGRPVQSVQAHATIPLGLRDLSDRPAAEREDAAAKLAIEEGRRPFALDRGPAMRAQFLRLSAAEHILLLTFHHIIVDGWSLGVLLRELSALYEAFLEGRSSLLPELPIQYADYALWQRQRWAKDLALAGQLAYWKRQLQGAPELIELPSDRPRPAGQSYRGARLPVTVSRDLRDKLAALGRDEGCTTYMVLLAAFQTLLARYSGRTDILVGSPVANRSLPETEPLIGHFLNLLVMRGDLSGNPPFRQLLNRIRDVALSAYAHQDVPFEKLVAELSPARALGHSPLFQVMLILQNNLPADTTKAGLAFQPFEVDPGIAKVDLTLDLKESDGGYAGWLEYATDLFDRARMERLIGDFEALLSGIAARPNDRLLQLPLATVATPLLPALDLALGREGENGGGLGNGARASAGRAVLEVSPSDGANRVTNLDQPLPRTPIESKLSAIWCEVLGIPKVGLHDSLFDLGGHSLLITMILSRIRKVFNLEMPIQRLFEAPTVAATAEWIEERVRPELRAQCH